MHDLAHRLAAGDLSPEVAKWLSDGMRRHLAGEDLEHALGLDRTAALRRRNQALLQAAALLGDDDGAWRCACRLAAAIRRYDARVAPLLERDPERELAPIDEALRRAFETGQRIPRTPRNLYELIR